MLIFSILKFHIFLSLFFKSANNTTDEIKEEKHSFSDKFRNLLYEAKVLYQNNFTPRKIKRYLKNQLEKIPGFNSYDSNFGYVVKIEEKEESENDKEEYSTVNEDVQLPIHKESFSERSKKKSSSQNISIIGQQLKYCGCFKCRMSRNSEDIGEEILSEESPTNKLTSQSKQEQTPQEYNETILYERESPEQEKMQHEPTEKKQIKLEQPQLEYVEKEHPQQKQIKQELVEEESKYQECTESFSELSDEYKDIIFYSTETGLD